MACRHGRTWPGASGTHAHSLVRSGLTHVGCHSPRFCSEPFFYLATYAARASPIPRCTARRYDLLNQLYRACGQWDKALEIAEKFDRIHLKSTHFAYAQVRCFAVGRA